MGFHLYEFGINKVITKSGSDSVSTTGASILGNNGLNGMLRSASHRRWHVYAGYHGDGIGRFHEAFDVNEMAVVNKIAAIYQNILLKHIPVEMTDDEIVAAAKASNVFFTWCDSNTRVSHVLTTRGDWSWGFIRNLT
jgi:hypothetical protein